MTEKTEKAKRDCRVITVANARGGVGKTFISIHLSYMLAEQGYNVLLIDTDPQGTVGSWLGLDSQVTLYNFLLNESSLDETIVKFSIGEPRAVAADKAETGQEGADTPESADAPDAKHMDVILSKESIKTAELGIVGMVAREYLLKNKLEEFDVFKRYDFVIIDTSPSLSLLNQNAYVASGEVLVPINMEPLAVVGASSIIESLKLIRRLLKHKITLLGIVPTFVSRQSNVAKQVLQLINSSYDSVLPQIRTSVRVKEASGSSLTINQYDPKNVVVEDLHQLVERVLNG